ncbi:hypothetical protein HDV05_006545 [Chytridiales sp. JEL 0842]|nr:hypothetical protein HDV05_006545 [Chytridiales sp. JEL 0842]
MSATVSPLNTFTSALLRSLPQHKQQIRSNVVSTYKGWEQSKKYLELETEKAKKGFVPEPRGEFKDPASFLKAIGRGCSDVADKFKDWNHLFTSTSEEMEKLGIAVAKRKHISNWKEWYRRGRDPYEIPIPKRQQKYLKIRKAVQLERLKRQGKAW